MDEKRISRRSFAKGIGPALAALAFFEPGLAQERRSKRAEAESGADLAAHAKSRLQKSRSPSDAPTITGTLTSTAAAQLPLATPDRQH